jgi:hypothetical protein
MDRYTGPVSKHYKWKALPKPHQTFQWRLRNRKIQHCCGGGGQVISIIYDFGRV